MEENLQEDFELAPNAKSATILLNTPIERGDQIIEKIVITKPEGSAFRGGLTTQAIARGEVDSLVILLPRIITPMITPEEVYKMGFDDLTLISGVLQSFLFQSKARLVAA